MPRRLVALAVAASFGCGDDGASIGGSSSTGEIATTSTDASSSSGIADTTDGSSSTTGDVPEPPPTCGSFDYGWRGMIAGPGEDDYDAALEAGAVTHDRLHFALTSLPLGLAGDIGIGPDDEAARATIEELARDGDDFGGDPRKLVVAWHKATGAFAGVAAAADAYRYGTMRDQGYPCEEIDRAHVQLERTIEGLHLATAVTGEPGLIARALTHRDWPGASETPTTPLFDGGGQPQPPEKTNGTFRDDASGEHPELVWEDACSRDQIIGWAIGYGAVWEVIEHDPTFDPALRERLQEDAAAIARQLMIVRDGGFDLEIWDPDGRPTPNGYLHEHNVDGQYVGFLNGQHAIMSTGIVAALASIADDPEIDDYLASLVGERNLMHVAATALLIDFGAGTNHSNYNRAFSGLWLVSRYLDDEAARAELPAAAERLYRIGGTGYGAERLGQAFFDLAYAITIADARAGADTTAEPDADALAKGLATLQSFPLAPVWSVAVEHCDADEIAAASCTLGDGTEVAVLGMVGHNDSLVVDQPLPIAIRPPSNFYWRTNPYEPNGGGDGTTAPSAADVRFAYWLGRWSRRAP